MSSMLGGDSKARPMGLMQTIGVAVPGERQVGAEIVERAMCTMAPQRCSLRHIAGSTRPQPIFLHVALDSGIPGLVAYLSLLALASYMSWNINSYGTDPRLGSLCLGLWGDLFAIHLFGLTDAIALGAKVGLFFWWNIGLIAALYKVVVRGDNRAVEAGPFQSMP